MLPADLAAALDPVALSRRAGILPDGWQADVLRSGADRLLLNCARQSGKSTTVATLAVHGALYDPGLVLLLSPSERQSKELFRKCLALWHALGRPVPAEAENTLTLELANGARLVSLPGAEGTIRGYSGAKLLVIDEAARVSDDVYRAVRPMVAVSGGRLVALSTPFGQRGWWWHAWVSAERWERFEVPARDCPRIPAAFLAEERAALGLFYAQEYECAFLDNLNALFSGADIEAMLVNDIPPLFPLTRYEEAPWNAPGRPATR